MIQYVEFSKACGDTARHGIAERTTHHQDTAGSMAFRWTCPAMLSNTFAFLSFSVCTWDSPGSCRSWEEDSQGGQGNTCPSPAAVLPLAYRSAAGEVPLGSCTTLTKLNTTSDRNMLAVPGFSLVRWVGFSVMLCFRRWKYSVRHAQQNGCFAAAPPTIAAASNVHHILPNTKDIC